LSREVLQDLNLIISERPHLLAEDHDRAKKARFFPQRHADDGAFFEPRDLSGCLREAEGAPAGPFCCSVVPNNNEFRGSTALHCGCRVKEGRYFRYSEGKFAV
jgi:hypothetical protein